MNIGLFFGSFNPIHIGHLIIANHILNTTNLQKIWFVVSPQNPFKESKTLLNEYDRLHLLRVAIQQDDRMKVSDVEFGLPKPSYTSVTLAHLTEKHPGYTFHVIMGGDSFQNLHKWHNYEYIIKHFPVMVYNRPGFTIDNAIGADLQIADAPLLEISATAIRTLIKENKSVKYLLPDAVREEIERTGYYKR
ncbi:nicotinate (nicotinamide) nucleotide adenylyltransferase [Terrimonas rubra]|uniref:Probable nicotinate-nucleotide adenylyltransferase n=1 Tax=Terrimonas rubra TaxID=1035890 RepID=A0ABW6A0X7_9BACT